MVNIERLTRLMRHVTLHPDRVNMGTWGARTACGTVRCIAGWHVELAGYPQNWARTRHYRRSIVPWRRWHYVWELESVTRSYGGDVAPDVAAAADLGLTSAEADLLFWSVDLDEAWRVVEDITDGALRRDSLVAP
jgi:hypothetical protein